MKRKQSPHFKITHSLFKNTFFRQSSLNGKLNPEIQNALSLNIFKNNILKFIRPTAKNIYAKA